jgi:prefoldin subunit 5
MVVVLAAAVIVLALTDTGGDTVTRTTVVTQTVRDPALARQVSGLAARVAAVDRTQATIGKTVGGLAKTVKALDARVAAVNVRLQHLPSPPSGSTRLQAQLQAQLRTLSAQIQTLTTCLYQVQKQLDDIQAFGLTRSALKKRVSGACLGILQPRYAGG